MQDQGHQDLEQRDSERKAKRSVSRRFAWGPAVCLVLLVGLVFPATSAAAEGVSAGVSTEKTRATSRLLLPYFRVNTNDGGGDTTLYALRNESLQAATVDILYYEADGPQAPQVTQQVVLGPKQIYPINVRDVPLLEQDGEGIAEGYVIFEVVGGSDVLSGDYFQVVPGEGFAVGERMVEADLDQANGLCSVFSTRFLSGGVFSGGTTLTYWFAADDLPVDPGTVSYTLFDEEGNAAFTSELPVAQVAGRFRVEDLLPPPPVSFDADAGAVEIQFSGTVGYLTATMSASGLFSVGVEAVCRN